VQPGEERIPIVTWRGESTHCNQMCLLVEVLKMFLKRD